MPSLCWLNYGVRAGLIVIATLLGCQDRDCLAAEKDAKTPSAGAAELAKVADQLNALGKQSDTDNNEILSADEQAELVKFVLAKHGPAWAERAKAFLRTADANADGQIELAEWKRAIQALGAARWRRPPRRWKEKPSWWP